jgi:hypothetical protein
MPPVRLENLETGFLIATDVRDSHGRLLIKAGIQISDKHLQIFKMWGIYEVNIEPVNNISSSEGSDTTEHTYPASVVSQAETVVAKRFLFSDGEDPVIEELRAISLQRTIREIYQKSL